MNTLAPENRLPSGLESTWNAFKSMSDDELNRELSNCLELTARNFVRIALLIRQKEERGHDLSELKIGMLGFLRMIAYGQLLPDILARFGAYPDLMKRIAPLPIPDQRRCLEDDGLKVALSDGEQTGHRLCDPRLLSKAELKQVFAADHVREPNEQIAWQRRQPVTSRRLMSPVVVDKKHQEIVVTGDKVRISREQLLMLLASLG